VRTYLSGGALLAPHARRVDAVVMRVAASPLGRFVWRHGVAVCIVLHCGGGTAAATATRRRSSVTVLSARVLARVCVFLRRRSVVAACSHRYCEVCSGAF
jgi:hypothetical protein